MRYRLQSLLMTVAFVLLACVAAHAKQPNFVFFLVDDLGYMDTGATNPKTFYETQNVFGLVAPVSM